MVGWLKDGLNSGGESVGLGLKNGAAAVFDFVGPVGQATEERIDLFTDLGLGTKAGVGRHFGADPAPDMLTGPNLMHLLCFVSDSMIDVVKPRAGASQGVRRLRG
jgi:hypothetical protein